MTTRHGPDGVDERQEHGAEGERDPGVTDHVGPAHGAPDREE